MFSEEDGINATDAPALAGFFIDRVGVISEKLIGDLLTLSRRVRFTLDVLDPFVLVVTGSPFPTRNGYFTPPGISLHNSAAACMTPASTY